MGGEHEAHGRDDVGRHAAAPQDDMDEATSGAAVAVGERMDRLELRMGDRRLQRDRQVVAVKERGEVVEQLVDVLRRRRDEGGAGRADADPPIQFCSARTTPPSGAWRVSSNSVRWIDSRSSRSNGRGSDASWIACSIALTLPAISRASSSRPRPAAARARRRCPIERPSIREEPTDS
ncbi:MAG: hypothetical protein WBC33_10500 [Conexibacter sp.]